MRVAMLAGLLLVAATALVKAPPAARIVSQQARWSGLAQVGELGAGAEELFVISGEVRNDGAAPLAAVRLVYELTADGEVVAREHGFNRRAEALREPAVESGAVAAAALAIAPLQPGDADLFRMAFVRGSVPRFDGWRVRVDDGFATLPAATRDAPRAR
ncbi:hypothetical protein KF840_21200 [bacterium]|nr:hypothetical protein [bacterium]